jgi:hypothetical protein
MLRKILIAAGSLSALLLLGLLIALVASNEARPVGTPGPDADALARRMLEATRADAWQQVGAVAWDFGGRQQHLWDRRRDFARVRWDDGDAEVLLDLRSRGGLARLGGQPVPAADAAPLLEKAWALWVNDSFWLNPVPKAFDPGVTRALVQHEGQPALLVSYDGPGGVTPGDAYLWRLGPDGRPTAWKMWVSIIPLGGLEASWDGWQELPGGAAVATAHKLGPITLQISDLKAGASWAQVEPGADPFAALLPARGADAPADASASQPAP